ncbi:hypothetical protein DXV76_08580 [Rhodobacteraceae bacterium CCMM004]|nr:hypothetical protein DXV76_08580 [Rhodobacteraceae bacterium CCMM004]
MLCLHSALLPDQIRIDGCADPGLAVAPAIGAGLSYVGAARTLTLAATGTPGVVEVNGLRCRVSETYGLTLAGEGRRRHALRHLDIRPLPGAGTPVAGMPVPLGGCLVAGRMPPPRQTLRVEAVSTRQAPRADTLGAAAFAAGTMITTRTGEVPVEALTPEHEVLTFDRGYRRPVWIHRRRVKGDSRLAPVVIRANALRNDRDLTVAPQQHLLLSGRRAQRHFSMSDVLVPALSLVGGALAYRCNRIATHYVHVLFARHEVIYAEGVPVESLLPSAAVLREFGGAAAAALAEIARTGAGALDHTPVVKRMRLTEGGPGGGAVPALDLAG